MLIGYILVDGSIVSDKKGAYWKNGKVTYIESPNHSEITGIGIRGNDIYMVGYISNNNGYTEAVYWKNGQMTKMPEFEKATPRKMIVYKNDIYVLGTVDEGNATRPVFWKNWVRKDIPITNGKIFGAVDITAGG